MLDTKMGLVTILLCIAKVLVGRKILQHSLEQVQNAAPDAEVAVNRATFLSLESHSQGEMAQ